MTWMTSFSRSCIFINEFRLRRSTMQVASIVVGDFFKERIDAIVQQVGTNTFYTCATEVHHAQPRVVIVDLEHPSAPELLRRFGSSAIAFGPHLRSELGVIAREFGATVYTRSAFLEHLERFLKHHATDIPSDCE
jgi:hypothetical protein